MLLGKLIRTILISVLFTFIMNGYLIAESNDLDYNYFNSRKTTFDNRDICIKTKGNWREFNNTCMDSCKAKFDKFYLCSIETSHGCDCGENKCWYKDKCVDDNIYKKIHEKELATKNKEIEIERKKREDEYKVVRAQIIDNLVSNANKRDSNSISDNIKEVYENTKEIIESKEIVIDKDNKLVTSIKDNYNKMEERLTSKNDENSSILGSLFNSSEANNETNNKNSDVIDKNDSGNISNNANSNKNNETNTDIPPAFKILLANEKNKINNSTNNSIDNITNNADKASSDIQRNTNNLPQLPKI